MDIDFHKKVLTNDSFRQSDCYNCMRVVDEMCVINGCKPKPIAVTAPVKTHCGYWWPNKSKLK